MDTEYTESDYSETKVTRRGALVRAAGALAATVGGAALKAEDGPAAVASGAVTCVLTPELTEGPYYIPGEKVRRNITEGRPGTPLALRLSVLNASTCKPIKGAAVDIWHCDAGGVYSGFGNSSSGGGGAPGGGGPGGGGQQTPTNKATFLRGIQRTDASGVALFDTIYPGWYPGRSVHIHVKVHVGGRVVHTGQLFFPDALTDAVYESEPYSSRGTRSNRNADDSIYVNGGSKGMLGLRKTGRGYTGRVTMGVVSS